MKPSCRHFRQKTMKILSIFFLLSSPVFAAPNATIIGKWIDAPTPFLRSGSHTFHADGTFSSKAEFIIIGKISVEGKWKIEDMILVSRITSSSRPRLMPVGLVIKEKIVVLTHDKMTTKSDPGGEYTTTTKEK